MRRLIAVMGCGGLGREVLPQVEQDVLIGKLASDSSIFYVVDDAYLAPSLDRREVIAWSTFAAMEGEKQFTVAVANPADRARIHTRCLAIGAAPLSVISSQALISPDASIGEAATIAPFAHVSINTSIGRSFQLNYYACVAHDCTIGDFVTFGPKAQCNGHVVIEDGAYIGAGALIRQGRLGEPVVIGRNAVVGMGAVVLNSVSAGEVVVGSPARPIRRKE